VPHFSRASFLREKWGFYNRRVFTVRSNNHHASSAIAYCALVVISLRANLRNAGRSKQDALRRKDMRSSYRWLAWLCLSLMLWTAVAEATHNHANQTAANSCTICVVAHSTTPAATFNNDDPVFVAIGRLQEEEDTANVRLSVCERGIRGPPTV
jgi:hypothetical protein